MVDQLGTEIITVPMCLRQGTRKGLLLCFSIISIACLPSDSIGFPPLDMDLRDWLVSDSKDDRDTQKRLHGFIYSLLKVTREQLETIAKEQGDYFPTPRQITCQWHRRYIRVTSSQ